MREHEAMGGNTGEGVRAPNTPQRNQNKTKPDEAEQNVKPLKVTWRRGMSHIWSKSGNVWRGDMTVCRGDAGGPACSSHRAPGVPVPPTNNLRQPRSDHSCLCGTNPAAKKNGKTTKRTKNPTYTHKHYPFWPFLCEYMLTHLSPSEHLCSICPPPHWNWAAKRWKRLRSEWVTFCTTCPSLHLTLRCEHMRILHYLTNKSETLD